MDFETQRLDVSRAPSNEDTTTVFCFSGESELLKAHELIARNTLQPWTEKRRAEKGVLYPYWLVCRAGVRDEMERVLKSAGIQWNDIESHFYSAVKDQSSENFSAENFTVHRPSAGKTPSGKSIENSWWQFWK